MTVSQALERILEELKALSDEEKQFLVAQLHGSNGSAAGSSAEQELESRLAGEGWLSMPVAPMPGSAPFQLGPPLAARGRPLSEILIEERILERSARSQPFPNTLNRCNGFAGFVRLKAKTHAAIVAG